jgi:hypothetical protein
MSRTHVYILIGLGLVIVILFVIILGMGVLYAVSGHTQNNVSQITTVPQRAVSTAIPAPTQIPTNESANYTLVNPQEIVSYADQHKGEFVEINITVFNIVNDQELQGDFVGTSDAVLVDMSEPFSGLYKDTDITIDGTVGGNKCFTNAFNATICQPWITDGHFYYPPTTIPGPISLPTPVPTMVPTPTPLPAGSTAVIGDWQIKVEKVVITDKLSEYGIFYLPTKGRFALIFMTVVNRETSPDSFSAANTVDLIDPEGNTYSEFMNGTFMAMDTYNVPDVPLINPGESAYVVSVFDIPVQKNIYAFTRAFPMLNPGSTVTLSVNIP